MRSRTLGTFLETRQGTMGFAGLSQGGNAKGTLVPSQVTFFLGLTRISNMMPGPHHHLSFLFCLQCCLLWGMQAPPHVAVVQWNTLPVPFSSDTPSPPSLTDCTALPMSLFLRCQLSWSCSCH